MLLFLPKQNFPGASILREVMTLSIMGNVFLFFFFNILNTNEHLSLQT